MDAVMNFRSVKELLHNSESYYIVCVDPNGNYSYVNNCYKKNFDSVVADFVGQPCHVNIHPDDVNACLEAGARCYENPGKLYPVRLRKHNGFGGFVITQWEFSLMMNDGEVEGVFCLGYDITEHENAKVEVNHINRDLEMKNELLEAIAFEQSHIVRAPLANLLGLINILKTMNLGAEGAEIFRMIDESCKQLDGVVKSIVKKTYSYQAD